MMTTPGRFVWFEYVSQDAPKAQGFFGELFGWTTKSVPMPDGAYAMIAAADGKTIGGYGAPPPGMTRPQWLPFLLVDSAAKTAAQVKRLGGAVEKDAHKIGDFATMAFIRDPHGALVALWQPAKLEPEVDAEAGHFTWTELPSKDPAASVAFYEQIGGFSTQKMEMPGMGAYYVLENGGKPRAGIMAQDMPDAPHTWLPYVGVASADHTADKAKRLGATLAVPPTDIPNIGRFAIVVDPQGVALGILAR
jgi:predicted enzyme related to lactoylglutathione lyase